METVDDLQCGGYRIIQDTDGFKFGTDAVLLADFAKNVRGKRLLDLCTGNGIVPILLAAKTNVEKIYGIEIQTKAAETAARSVQLNGLTERIQIINGDLREKHFEKRFFDAVTCNPPYMKASSAIVNENDAKMIARHEICCSLEDVISAAASLLTVGGRFFMVHRPTRLAEVITCMKKYKLEPKRLRLVYPDRLSEPVLFLTEGLLFGKEEIRIMPPLFLKGEDGGESGELKAIYGRK